MTQVKNVHINLTFFHFQFIGSVLNKNYHNNLHSMFYRFYVEQKLSQQLTFNNQNESDPL